MKIIGIDGCKAGWFASIFNHDLSITFDIFSNITQLWAIHNDADVILIDIPIGLVECDTAERKCDKDARRTLGPGRGSSVFVVPSRAAIYTDDYVEGSSINYDKTGRWLAKQTWGIVPKIKELDLFLLDNSPARSVIKESHPEVGFWALNNGHPMKFKKKQNEGLIERLNLLQNYLEGIDVIYQSALGKYKRSQLAKDDVLDAMCLMVNGMLGFRQGFDTLPPVPQIDDKGLSMQIIYAKKGSAYC